jgi:hypothetical protein
MTMRIPIVASFVLLASCEYDAPLNTNELSAPGLGNVISGVVVSGATDPGNTLVTVYAADNPGPPTGTGAPLTFAPVPAHTYTGAGAGIQSAPFAVTGLENGSYLVNALVDNDGDFNPFVSALAGATCGDWVGTHVQEVTGTDPAVVTVRGGKQRHDVTVVAGLEIISERPAFTFVSPVEMSKATGKESGENILIALDLTYRIRTTGVATAFGDGLPLDLAPACDTDPTLPSTCETSPSCRCDPETLAPCDGAFWLYFADNDGDGVTDPYPAELQASAGLMDVWPRVYLSYLGEPVEEDGVKSFVNDVPEGERWVAENYPLGIEIALNGGNTEPFGTTGVPFPVNEMSVLWSPVFRHYHPDGVDGEDVANGPFDFIDLRLPEYDVDDVPSGHWSVTLISWTGQTWAMPNEIGLQGLPSLDAGFVPSTQAETLVIVD